MWYWFVLFWARVILLVVFRVRVIGCRNVPAAGPVILASNHQSYLDPPLVGVVMSRQVHYMARKSLFGRFRPFAWLIRSVNAFPAARGKTDASAVRETMRRLKKGAAVLVFPEGTRTCTGRIGTLKRGIFAVAARCGAPVVPTMIDGAFEAWPRSRKFPRPRPIVVAFGEPLRSERFGGDPEAMAAECRRRIEALRQEARSVNGGAAAEGARS